MPHTNAAITSGDFATRARWAAKQGNPLWLWPEISPASWQSALAEIARATAHVLGARDGTALVCGDALPFGVAAFTSGMGPLLGHWANAGLLSGDPKILELLQVHLDQNSIRMTRLGEHARAAVAALSRAGVTVTVLKGMHSAYTYFPTPGTRPVSDIDLLIKSADEAAAGNVMSALGYVPGPPRRGERTWRLPGVPTEPECVSMVRSDGPWSVDLHTSLERQSSPGAPPVRLDEALRDKSTGPWPPSPRGRTFAGPALAFYLACHAGLGFSSLSLIRLTELVLVIRSIAETGQLDWDEFRELATVSGNPASAYAALRMTSKLAPGIVPEDVLRWLERRTPGPVLRFLATLGPATCHRVARCSLTERFMWVDSFGGWLREGWGTLVPPVSPREMASIYRRRLAAVMRGSVSR